VISRVKSLPQVAATVGTFYGQAMTAGDSYTTGNNRVRVVAAAAGTFYGVAMTAGDIYTVAGNGTPGFSGDVGPAARAEVDQPFGAGVEAAGNLLAAELFDGRVREISR
jgi:hypothetical protein